MVITILPSGVNMSDEAKQPDPPKEKKPQQKKSYRIKELIEELRLFDLNAWVRITPEELKARLPNHTPKGIVHKYAHEFRTKFMDTFPDWGISNIDDAQAYYSATVNYIGDNKIPIQFRCTSFMVQFLYKNDGHQNIGDINITASYDFKPIKISIADPTGLDKIIEIFKCINTAYNKILAAAIEAEQDLICNNIEIYHKKSRGYYEN